MEQVKDHRPVFSPEKFVDLPGKSRRGVVQGKALAQTLRQHPQLAVKSGLLAQRLDEQFLFLDLGLGKISFFFEVLALQDDLRLFFIQPQIKREQIKQNGGQADGKEDKKRGFVKNRVDKKSDEDKN